MSEAFIMKVFGWVLGRLLDLYEDIAKVYIMCGNVKES